MPRFSLKSFTIIVICASIFLVLWWIRYNAPNDNLSVDGDTVTLTGTISNDPKISGNSAQFTVDNWKIYGNTNDELEYGDLVSVTGVFGAVNTIKHAEITVLPPSQTNQFQKSLGSLKKTLAPIPYQFLDQRAAELVNGMVLGVKPNDKYFMSDLRRTGTIHIIVVSGENLSIVAGFILRFRNRLGKRRVLILSFVVIWLYALITGGQPPVMRAAIMITFAYTAQVLGRQYWDFYALALAAAIMLLMKPFLLYDISFQLSFMATLGVIAFTKPIYRAIRDANFSPIALINKIPFGVSENLAATLAAQLMVDPLILYNFHQFSVLSPVVNVLVLPVVLYLTLTGAVLLFAGYFWPVLGIIISYLIVLPATYFSTMTTFFAQLPVVSKTITGFSLWMVIAYYGYILLAVCIIKYYIGQRKPIAQSEYNLQILQPDNTILSLSKE